MLSVLALGELNEHRLPQASNPVGRGPPAFTTTSLLPSWTPGLQSAWESSGLALRSHECTHQNSDRERSCLDRELKQTRVPVSIWRANLPQAFFAKKGLTVGVGWVLDLSAVHVNLVNAHDSYGKLTRRCRGRSYARYANATWYADTRIAYILKSCEGGRAFPAEYSCLTDMEVALAAQREFWGRINELKHCKRSTMLHNEALATFTTKHILGVFVDLSFSPTNTTRDYAELAAKAAGGVPVFGLVPVQSSEFGLVPTSVRRMASAPAINAQINAQINAPAINASAKSCLLDQTPVQTQNYLAKLYGSLNVHRAASNWSWPSADVIWLDKLDPSVADCLMHHRTPGVWTVHEATGFYAPPIGSKMEYPVVWQYRPELACEGQAAEHGGERSLPTESNGSWIEVFRYQWLDSHESTRDDTTWMYRARGSGVWYWTGRTLLFHDTVDLQYYMLRRFSHIAASGVSIPKNKRKLIKVAAKLLKPEFQTIVFSKHVDRGFQHNHRCSGPKRGWDANYFSVYEVLAIQKIPSPKAFSVCFRNDRCASLGVRLKAGWFDGGDTNQSWNWPCVQDPLTRNANLGKPDAKWHYLTVRCQSEPVTKEPY